MGKPHVFPSTYLGMGVVKGGDYCLRVNFVVKWGSLGKEREGRGAEWFNLINTVSERVVEI